jgi:ABC-type uncharacterized transport system substrate-binding protein
MRMVGVLLVSAMIVIPTLAGFALARSFRGALFTAMGVAVVAMMVGLVLAYYLGLAAGASVVLTALTIFALTGPLKRIRALGPAALVVFALIPGIAHAHPHVWVDYEAVVRFGAEGPEGVRFDWAFDEMISALIIQKYDTDRDGKFSPAETRLIEKEHFSYLKDYNFFVDLKVNGAPVAVKTVKDFEARNQKGQLHYLFTVPISGAARQEGAVDVNVTDPTFYSAFAIAGKGITAEVVAAYRADCRAMRDPKTRIPEGLRCSYRRQGR